MDYFFLGIPYLEILGPPLPDRCFHARSAAIYPVSKKNYTSSYRPPSFLFSNFTLNCIIYFRESMSYDSVVRRGLPPTPSASLTHHLEDSELELDRYHATKFHWSVSFYYFCYYTYLTLQSLNQSSSSHHPQITRRTWHSYISSWWSTTIDWRGACSVSWISLLNSLVVCNHIKLLSFLRVVPSVPPWQAPWPVCSPIYHHIQFAPTHLHYAWS